MNIPIPDQPGQYSVQDPKPQEPGQQLGNELEYELQNGADKYEMRH